MNISYDDRQLRRMQELELMEAVEIKRVCEKHGIKYFIMYGSLLGAVRHGGFIPWDNDMDFGMLREDYEKFIIACETDLDDKFFLQTWDTDPLYPFPWAKIQLRGTRFANESEPDNPNNGIAVDIFPFDAVPDSEFANKLAAIRRVVCTRILMLKRGYSLNGQSESAMKKMMYGAIAVLSKLFSFDAVKNYYARRMTKFNGKPTENLVCAFTSYKVETIKREWTRRLAPVTFESVEFPAFEQKEAFLTHQYGDYMTPPPVEEREAHECSYLDFGPYA